MPELPEVETVCRGLRPHLEGRRLVRAVARRPDLRVPLPEAFAERLTGRVVMALDRRAKYILAHLDSGETMVVHLGMSGRMMVLAEGATAARPRAGADSRHDHVVFDTDRGERIVYNDPRRFGLMTLVATDALDEHQFFAGMGPEPLGNSFSGALLAERFAGRRAPVKTVLLDQRVVAGLGNIYVCESLYQAALRPPARAGSLTVAECERLAHEVRDVLQRAIAAGGSSLRDYVQASGELGYFQHSFAVYGREGEPCPGCDCDAGIQRIVQSNRSTFYCAARQS